MKSNSLYCIIKVTPEFQEIGECRLIVILPLLYNFAIYTESIIRRSASSGRFCHIYLNLSPYYITEVNPELHKNSECRLFDLLCLKIYPRCVTRASRNSKCRIIAYIITSYII